MLEIRRRISAPFSGLSGISATDAEPEVGANSVPSVRTVVAFPPDPLVVLGASGACSWLCVCAWTAARRLRQVLMSHLIR